MHMISGLIAEAAVIDQLASRLGLPSPTMLSLGFGFLPLDEFNLEKIVKGNKGDPIQGFRYLTSELIEILCRSSRLGVFAYVETEYFGGVGNQGAVVFQAGAVSFGPKSAEIGPISEALAILGIANSAPPNDGFERLGLGQYRSNEAIQKADQQRAGPPRSTSRRSQNSMIIWCFIAIIVIAIAAIIASNLEISFKPPRLR